MPINLGGLIKSYQSVGVDGTFSTDVLQSSSADALVPAQRWRIRWSGRDAERSREIGASRRRVDETSRRILEASEENDEKPEEGRKEGRGERSRRCNGGEKCEKFRRSTLQYPVVSLSCDVIYVPRKLLYRFER